MPWSLPHSCARSLATLAVAGLVGACSGLGPAVPGTSRVAQRLAVRTAATAARPTFEEAHAAALAEARRQAGARVPLASAAGQGVGRDGRLVAGEQGTWWFLFRLPGGGMPRFVDVAVDAGGVLRASVAEMPTGLQGFAYDPDQAVPAARAVAAALADGLPGVSAHVSLAPADGLFFGAQQTPYVGPLTFMVGTDHRYSDHRLVSARTGLLRRGPDAAELARMRTLMTPLLVRWHDQLTHGERRPVTQADLVAAGMVPQGAAAWLKMNDADRDGVVAQAELVATFTTPEFLRAWREGVIMGELWRADGDRDERLSPAEAANVTLEFFDFNGAAKRLPMPVTPKELAARDLGGDGALDANEFAPLGVDKTLALVALNPEASNALVWGATKPWSH